MVLTDVNVMIHAYRADMPEHVRFRDWLLQVVNGPSAYRDFARFPGLRWRHPFTA